MAYTVDSGGFWSAQQPSAPPGAQPQWWWVDQLRGAPGPQGETGVGLPGPCGQIGPPGKMGATGPAGPAGKNSFSFSQTLFIVPACGAAPVTATVTDSSWMTPGLLVYVPGAGTFTVVGSPPSPNTVLLANSCDPNNAAAGTQISAGIQVSPAALQGPSGAQGIPGPAGPPGPQGVGGASVYTTLAQLWTVPATNSIAFVTAADAFSVGLIVYIEGAGYFAVTGVDKTANTLTLVNQNYPGDQPPGTIVPAGNTVSGTGPQGPQGVPGIAGPAGPQGAVGVAPTGAIMMYGAATPPGGWLLCDGSAISRTGYSALFAVIATTYGSGDGTSTFNLPNFQGRVALGVGQSSAAGATAHALASVGGEETHALVVAELALHTHALTISATEATHVHTVPVHGHGWNDANHKHISPSHGHVLNWSDPGHSHTITGSAQGFSGGSFNSWDRVSGTHYTDSSTTNISASVAASGDFWTNGNMTNWGAVGSVANAAAFNTTANAGTITASGTAANTGSGTAHNTLPPYLTVQYIIKT